MRKIILDLNPLGSPKEIHEYLAMKFDFPDYYGENLDALYDCLTEITEDTCVGFFEPASERTISPYLRRMKMVFRDAEDENPHLAVIFGNLEDNFDRRF